jgi:hypothetical protein
VDEPKSKPGRKAKSKDGEVMKLHAIRWTDAQWLDALEVGADAIRAWVTKQAAKLRRAKGKT